MAENKKLSPIIFCFMIISVMPGPTLWAKEVCPLGTCFEAKKVVNGINLFLGGVAFFRRAFLQIYEVGLYVPKGIRNESQVLSSEVAKTVVVEYDRDIDVRELFDEFRKNLPPNQANDPTLKSQFVEIAAAVYPIQAGERHEFVYEPGKGTTLFKNGESKLRIPGSRFARTFFGFWLTRHNSGNQLLRPGTLQV